MRYKQLNWSTQLCCTTRATTSMLIRHHMIVKTGWCCSMHAIDDKVDHDHRFSVSIPLSFFYNVNHDQFIWACNSIQPFHSYLALISFQIPIFSTKSSRIDLIVKWDVQKWTSVFVSLLLYKSFSVCYL